MLDRQYPRGSEWRKWDLQVHTPFSELNNGFGTDFDSYAKRLIEAAVDAEIAVVGVTDYFCIEGYEKLLQLLRDEEKLTQLVGEHLASKVRDILFLPNVEFRTSVIVRDSDGNDSRVGFHVLFSDELSPEDIDENFLRELKFTAEGTPGAPDEKWPLTRTNLQKLGQILKSQHANFASHSDLFVGMMTAVVDHSEAVRVLEGKRSIFGDKYLISLPCDEDLSDISWDGQGHLQRKLLIQKSHFLFSANQGTRQFALGKRHPTREAFLREFKTLKPCLHASDAHKFSELFAPSGNRHTWIRANPTFDGLRQVLNEPEERVFVGEIPPSLQLISRRPTRVIESVEIAKCSKASINEKWFNVSLPLNPGLAAIIGNKGSGKSALADVLGLLGNTPRYGSFSFLRHEKFRDPKKNLAKQFCAALKWNDGTEERVENLNVDPGRSAVEKIKYIPQNYLEEICNEIELGQGSRFYSELEQVIFSYIPSPDRLRFVTLQQLLDYRSEEADKAIQLLIDDIQTLNKEIVECEDSLAPEFVSALERMKEEKLRELAAHDAGKPIAVPKPEEDESVRQETRTTADAIDQAQAELEGIAKRIAELREMDAKLARQALIAEKLRGKLENLRTQVTTAQEEAKPDFAELGIDLGQVISVTISLAPVDELLKHIRLQRASISNQLGRGNEEGLEQKRSAIEGQVEELQARLSAPQRQYQAYVKRLEEWEVKRADIVGKPEIAGSMENLDQQLRQIRDLPILLQRLRRKRDRKLLEIFRQKQRLKAYYESYYQGVQAFLQDHETARRVGFQFTFNVSIMQRGFAGHFLSFIDQRRLGPFLGTDEGSREMKHLIDETDFDSALDVLRFTRRLFRKMTLHQGRTLGVKDQVNRGIGMRSVYDFVFSLSYLSPVYNLRWAGKGLEQLSPGERGNLLLIFYLIVDKDDTPLVIDQPEENLDNQTIFRTLVPCIREAKKRRQIVIVTHNPNLAVVCDADQVIYAEMNKTSGNEVTYDSGSLENPRINRHVVDVLEGTRPAFDQRDRVYLPSVSNLGTVESHLTATGLESDGLTP